MGDEEDQDPREPRRPEDDDSPLLHPGNEGHDAERQRDRLEKWASQEDDLGPDARALQEELDRARAAHAPLEEVLPLEPPTPPPPRVTSPEAPEDLHYRQEDRAPPYGKRSRRT